MVDKVYTPTSKYKKEFATEPTKTNFLLALALYGKRLTVTQKSPGYYASRMYVVPPGKMFFLTNINIAIDFAVSGSENQAQIYINENNKQILFAVTAYSSTGNTNRSAYVNYPFPIVLRAGEDFGVECFNGTHIVTWCITFQGYELDTDLVPNLK